MEDFEELELTKEQIKAAKAVYSAIKKAEKLGVEFWDNYGTLSCYNGLKIDCIEMDDRRGGIPLSENENLVYYELLKNFHAGNSDDPIWIIPR
jgi:hypothetical protein